MIHAAVAFGCGRRRPGAPRVGHHTAVPTATPDAPRRARVGLWGLFDAGDLDGAAVRTVLDAELSRRLPGVELVAASPLGRPTARDDGRTPRTLATLDAAAVDCIVVAGALPLDGEALQAAYGDAFAGDAEATLRLLLGGDVPRVAWHGVALRGSPAGLARVAHRPALLSVRDAASLAAVLQGDAAVQALPVPHDAILLSRVLHAGALRRRVETWRALGVLPPDGGVVLLDAAALHGRGGGSVRAAVGAVAAGSGHNVVVAGDGEGAATAALPDAAGVWDVAAAVSVAAAVVSATPVLSAIAAGYGVPAVVLPGGSATGDAGLPGEIAAEGEEVAGALHRALQSRAAPPREANAVLDSDLDRLAAWTGAAGARAHPRRAPSPPSRDRLLLTRMRRALLGEVGELQARLAQAESQHAAELAQAREEARRWRDEAERVTTSKTWRYTEPARSAYRRLRHRTR